MRRIHMRSIRLCWMMAELLLIIFSISHSTAMLSTSINSSKLSVGDRIRLIVTAIIPKDATITPPNTDSDFGSITVKEWNLNKTEGEKNDSLVYEYIITTYTPEPCTIPRLPFFLENNGMTDMLKTESIPLQILSVLPSDTVDILDMKAPLSAGKKPKWWLWLLSGIAGIILLVTMSILAVRHFRKPPPPPPPIPPYEEAIDALATLGTKKFLQRGLIREFVFELSEIFKRYIGRRFDCNATDFTTEEMIAWSGARDLQKELRLSLEWFFKNTDLVKFARFIPDNRTIERFESEVRGFLEATKPVVEPQEHVPVTSENNNPTPGNPSLPAAKGADA